MDLQQMLNDLLKQKQNGGNGMRGNYEVDPQDDKVGIIKKGIIIGAGVVVAITLFAQSTTIVQPGYQGVQFSLAGGLKDKTLGQGLKWHAPWVNVTQYPVSTETVYLTKKKTKHSEGNESMSVNTSDGKSVDVDIVYSYHMEPKKLPHIFTKFRRQESPAIEDSYLKTQLKTVIQEVTTEHSVLAVYADDRADVTKKINEKLGKVLARDGIILENFAMSDVRPDQKTLVSLQKIADAQNHQEYLKREEANKTQEAINNKVEAEGKKQVAIVNAQAKAEQTRIEAEAQAAANEKLNQSLTPAIIQDNWIKRWDGMMPKVGGASNSMIQIPSDLLK